MPRSGRGARFATTTMRLPTRAAGSGYACAMPATMVRGSGSPVHGELQELVRALDLRAAHDRDAQLDLREVVVLDDAGVARKRAFALAFVAVSAGLVAFDTLGAGCAASTRGGDDELLHLAFGSSRPICGASRRRRHPANGSTPSSQVAGRSCPNAATRPSQQA